MSQIAAKRRTIRARQSNHLASNLEILSILLMIAGWGWISGTYSQPMNVWWGILSDAFQMLPLVLLLWLSLVYFHAFAENRHSKAANVGVSAVAVFSILSCLLFVLGSLKHPESFEIHTITSVLPVIVLNLGAILWLAIPIPARYAIRAAVPVADVSGSREFTSASKEQTAHRQTVNGIAR